MKKIENNQELSYKDHVLLTIGFYFIVEFFAFIHTRFMQVTFQIESAVHISYFVAALIASFMAFYFLYLGERFDLFLQFRKVSKRESILSSIKTTIEPLGKKELFTIVVFVFFYLCFTSMIAAITSILLVNLIGITATKITYIVLMILATRYLLYLFQIGNFQFTSIAKEKGNV